MITKTPTQLELLLKELVWRYFWICLPYLDSVLIHRSFYCAHRLRYISGSQPFYPSGPVKNAKKLQTGTTQSQWMHQIITVILSTKGVVYGFILRILVFRKKI